MSGTFGWIYKPEDESGFHFQFFPETGIVQMIDEETESEETDIAKEWEDLKFSSKDKFIAFCEEKLEEETE